MGSIFLMTTTYRIWLIVGLALFAAFGTSAPARAAELDELKATIQSMQKSMEQMQARIAELERENHKQKQQVAASKAAPPAAVAPELTARFFELPLREAREAFERIYFEQLLGKEQSNMSRVAERAGLERTHLYRKLRSLGVDFRNISDD